MNKKKAQEEKKAPDFFTTSMGYKIEINPIPPFLMDKATQGVVYPEKPMYEVETAGGEIEYHPHDETTLANDADRAIWDAYQSALTAAQEQENEGMMRIMLLKGIGVEMQGEAFEDWLEEQEFLGIEVPKGKSARKVHYIESEILGNNDDIAEIMTRIVAASGVSQEVVDSAKESFRAAAFGQSIESIDSETGEMET